MKKIIYRVRNWPEYNRALKNRYRLTIYMTEEVLSSWYAPPTGRRGAPRRYSDLAIKFVLTIRALLNLPLRGCQGLVEFLFSSAEIPLECPDYTTLSRRGRTVKLNLRRPRKGEKLFIAVDSSGLKIYGEGEWKVRMHGVCKRRTWRKLHIGVDVDTGLMVSGVLSTSDVHDSEVLPLLLEGLRGAVKAVAADGAYDTRRVYDAVSDVGADALIPPRKGARIWGCESRRGPPCARNENLRHIRLHGLKDWKERSGYHKRSLSETAFSRLKRIFGDRLRSRDFSNQVTESFLRLSLLNRMTELGMPDSYPVSN